MAASYYRSASFAVKLYLKVNDNYIYLCECGDSTNDENYYNDSLTLSLSGSYVSSPNIPLITSYSTSADLYIKVSGSVNYHAIDVGWGVSGSSAGCSVNLNYDMLKYILGYTYFKYCHTGATYNLYLNTSSGNYYSGTSVKSNNNTSGGYGVNNSIYASGSGQIYIPTNISYTTTGYASYESYSGSGEQRYQVSFNSGYVKIGQLSAYHSTWPDSTWDTEKNFKKCPTISVTDRFYFNKIPATGFSVWVNDPDLGDYMQIQVTCNSGGYIGSNYTTKTPLSFKQPRREIVLNSNLNVKFNCKPSISTDLYYIGTEKLTDTSLVTSANWAKLLNDNGESFKFDGVSYFYLDIKNYDELLESLHDTWNTGTINIEVSTDTNSKYAPYSITLYTLNFKPNTLYTSPGRIFNSHIKQCIPYCAYNSSNKFYYNVYGDGFAPRSMYSIAGNDFPDEPYSSEYGELVIFKSYNTFVCSSTNYDNTSRTISVNLNISDIIDSTDSSTLMHPCIVSYLCEVKYLPDNPASGSTYDILIHSSQEYNKFTEYHIINIAIPQIIKTETVEKEAITIKDYINEFINYPDYSNYDINGNIDVLYNRFGDPETDDVENSVLSKTTFTDLLFYDNSAITDLDPSSITGKLVTTYNTNEGKPFNKTLFFDLNSSASNSYFTDKAVYQNTLINSLFGNNSYEDHAKVITDNNFICWCYGPIATASKTDWKYFNFYVPLTRNQNFSLISSSYIDSSTNTSEDYSEETNNYRNLSFTLPNSSNYTGIEY